MIKKNKKKLGPLSSDSPCKLDILGHDCDSLGMNGAQVSVLKQADKVGLTCFL